MNVSKIKPEEVNLLIQVFSLPKEVVFYDPQNRLADCSQRVITDITTLLQQSSLFKVCVNLSDAKLEILPFDFILEINGSKQQYKSFYCEEFSTINNPDGSLRWFQSSDSKQATFLNLYNSVGLKASLFKMAVRMAFSITLQKLVFSGRFCLYSKTQNYFQRQFENKEVAVFTGTIGENRKAVAALCENGHPSHFIKIPISEKATQLVRSEHQHLKTLNQYGFENLNIPFSELSSKGLQLTNIQPDETLSSISITDIHLKALKDLYACTSQMKILGDLDVFKTIHHRISGIKESIKKSTGNIPNQKAERLAYNIKVLFNSFDESEIGAVAYAHGDFAPWNMFVSEQQIHVYDWELAMPEQLLLYDAFHFVFQSSILILHQSFSQIKLKTKQLEHLPLVKDIVEKYQLDFWNSYRWYLLSNCSYYLDLYLKQPHLHKQAYWLLDCWIEATNDAIKTMKQKRILVS